MDAEPDVDGRLHDVPAMHHEDAEPRVPPQAVLDERRQRIEEVRRGVVHGAHAVQVDVVPVAGLVDERAGVEACGQLGRQRTGVQVVHLERGAAPRSTHRIAATAMRCDQHDRR